MVTFFVTQLDPSCSVVLGHNWLKQYNPLIDWFKGSISFERRDTSVPSAASSEARASTASAAHPSPASLEESVPPRISLLSAPAFFRAVQLEGSHSFTISLKTDEASGRLVIPEKSEPVADLEGVPEKYHHFADVFSKQKADRLAPHRPYDLKIDIEPGTTPPLGPIYPLSQSELAAIREFLDEHLAMGYICPSKSPFGAPVLFINKKDGSLRLCVDFRGLNAITRKDKYPLPLVADLLDTPRHARIFTKIDLRHASHLVRIAEGDEWKTTFRTRYGSFEWLVMPFGLTNAPVAFQRFVNDIFSDLIDICVIIYLDDILVYSEDRALHDEQVSEVFRRLRANGLFANGKKCFFDQDSVEYLGFIIGPEGLRTDEAKVKVIQDWPEPRKVKDIQSFLGFANFYRHFIRNYSDITVPLTRLTRKSQPWDFDDDCRSAFQSLKDSFSSAPILSHWQPDLQIVVETDASDYAIAAIISVIHSDGEIHPVAFLSRTLSASELNYDVHDKELLAIFEAFKHWRHYLEGSTFPIDVVTDHKNLEYFSTTKLLTRRQARWSEFLSTFNLVIRFRPGRLGGKPDALTRRWDVYPKEGESNYSVVNPHNFKPVFTTEQLSTSIRATSLYVPILCGIMVMDIEKVHQDILTAQSSDPTLQSHLEDPSDSGNTRWSQDSLGFIHYDGHIYVPDSDNLHLRILQFKHDHLVSGHFGINKTLELIRREYTWPNLRDFVTQYCKSCTVCLRSKSQCHKPYGLLKQLPIPEKPWNSISMDFIEQLPSSEGHTSILVIVDRLSKQGIFIPTHVSITSAQLAELFVIHVFSKHGIPSHVTSDRGSEFVSHFFKSLGKALDMKLHFTSGYHPEGDGQTERVNQTLEQYLRVYCNYQQDNWKSLLPLAEFAYNNSPNATTGISPFFANKGYNPNLSIHPERDLASVRAQEFVTDLDELHQELRKNIASAQIRYKVSADKHRLPSPNFKIGDQVFVKAQFFRTTRPSKKLSERFLGPYEIIGQPGTLSYMLWLPETFRAVHPVSQEAS